MSTTVNELKALVLSYHPVVVIETVEEDRVQDLISRVAGDLRMIAFEWSATRGLLRTPGTVSYPGTTDPLGALRSIEGIGAEGIFQLKDIGPQLSTPAVARAVRDLTRLFTGTRSTLVVTGYPVELPPEIHQSAVSLRWSLPDERELREVASSVVKSLRARRVAVNVSDEDARAIVRALSGLTLTQARQVLAYAAIESGKLTADEIAAIIRRKGELLRQTGMLDYVPPEANTFELGGFNRLKKWLDLTSAGFTPEARKMNLPAPKGVLFVGVQGCGKSLAAKYIARKWQMPLLKLDAGRLYDKYVGETEKNFGRVTGVAESMAPVVLWIDEIEKAFATGDSNDADGGLSRRMLGSFLTWLQEKRAEVFVVGAANDIDSLPPELLRKGRFDEIFFVDLPDAEERSQIFSIHLKLRKQEPERFDLASLVAGSEGFSGAEIEHAVIAAFYRALHEKHPLASEGILDELRGTVPLSRSRSEDIEALRAMSKGRFVPVSGD